MAKKTTLTETVEIPQGVTIKLENKDLIVTGKKGEVRKVLSNPRVNATIDGNIVKLHAQEATKRDKAVIKTYKSHVDNACFGCLNGYEYKLKICSGHFPMNVSVSNNVLEIKNFLGEKVPRKVKIKQGVTVKVDGSSITVEGPDKEIAGQVAADIEQATRRPGFDRRIFQDGIYIIDKAGKEI